MRPTLQPLLSSTCLVSACTECALMPSSTMCPADASCFVSQTSSFVQIPADNAQRERSIRSAQALLNDAYGVLADHVLKHRDSTDSSSSSLGLSSGGGGSSGVRSSGISSVWAAAFGRKKSASRKGAADAASEAAGTTAAASSALAAAADTGLVACLARMRHHKTGKLFSRNEMIPEIGALMMAGFDTSSHTIAWCL